ncbi:hypothetical protein D3C84_524600 [compost metagenome]
MRSYRSALTYWSTWLQQRYGPALGDAPLPTTVALLVLLNHLVRPLPDGSWVQLPRSIDAPLVAAWVQAKSEPLAFNAVSHRLAVLGKWHRINGWVSPTEVAALKSLLREARKAQSRQGVILRKKTALVIEPLQAPLTTCSDACAGAAIAPCSCWPGVEAAVLRGSGLAGHGCATTGCRHLAVCLGHPKNRLGRVARSRCADWRRKPSPLGSKQHRLLKGRCSNSCTKEVRPVPRRCLHTKWRESSSASASWQGFRGIGPRTFCARDFSPRQDARACRSAT